ncbi:MAG: carboxypeptidase regulatory-like domain-containing protein [Polyangiaceae bacterium]|nr:carboxypeptidase regulatory-like domain-containing protein [Polyangiaceae bacterium]
MRSRPSVVMAAPRAGAARSSGGPLLALVAALLAPRLASAQIAGVVRDEAGVPLADARVSVQASTIEATTDSTGAFALPDASGTDLVIVAARAGYFNGWSVVTAPATAVALALEAVPEWDDPAYLPQPPTECGTCHAEQFGDWRVSPMAKAGKNAWVQDVYDGTATAGGLGGFVYVRDSLLAAKNPASECAACHQPESWWSDPYAPLAPWAGGTAPEERGVSCEICHKIAAVDPARTNFPGLWPGVVRVAKPPVSPPLQVMFGVLGDVTFEMADTMRASYQPQLGALVCATCHQDKNDPDEDGDFEEPNGVVSEPTYQEWVESPYADPTSPRYATCVDCHMKPSGADQACSVQVPELKRPPGDVRSHTFPGTTLEFLQSAVRLGLEAGREGDQLRVAVEVENDSTGHHVPTGVTIRNVILLVEAWQEPGSTPLEALGDQLVHELGGVGDPSQGYYAGLPGKLFAKVNHDAQGAGPTFFTEATGITWDTRIAPLATDRTEYAFAIPSGATEVRVRARLIYRRSWRALVDAKQWTTDGHGQPLADLQAPHFGALMNQVEATVAVCDAGGCDEPPPVSAAPASEGGCACRAGREPAGRGARGLLPWAAALALGAAGGRRRRAV